MTPSSGHILDQWTPRSSASLLPSSKVEFLNLFRRPQESTSTTKAWARADGAAHERCDERCVELDRSNPVSIIRAGCCEWKAHS